MGDRDDGRLLGVAARDVFVFFARAGQAGGRALCPTAQGMEDESAAALPVFLRVSGAADGSVVAAVFTGQPQHCRAAGQAGKDWRGDLAGEYLRGGCCGFSAQSIPEKSREPGKNLPARFVGIFAAPELFF